VKPKKRKTKTKNNLQFTQSLAYSNIESNHIMTTSINPANYTAHLHPGKFEGETAATEYFHEQMLNGDGEAIFAEIPVADGPDDFTYDEDAQADIFFIDADESEAFGLPIGACFMIREDSQGFVYGSVHANRDEAQAKFNSWLGL
jgi:hypothetical protein